MSINYAFGFSLTLLILVGLNIYFFYTLNAVGKKGYSSPVFSLPSYNDQAPGIYKEINKYFKYLPSQYKNKNSKFLPLQRKLIQIFNSTNIKYHKDLWKSTENWESNESLFPHIHGAPGKILHAIRTSPIAQVDVAPTGTQLKLQLFVEGNKILYFKPKRYTLTRILHGNIYGGYDRHNSEVFAYYLAMVMDFKWIAPSVIRRIHMTKDVVPVATAELNKTFIKIGTKICTYGKCLYCNANETVCPDEKGELEGAAILLFNKSFKSHLSPWRRSYKSKKMEWEMDDNFCKKMSHFFSTKRILNLVDVSIFDFLIQNGDRHHYQVYNNNILLFDNGKGLGNPTVDKLDILAPLYQCCIISYSTWQHLEMLSGGILTETIKMLSSFQGEKLATEDHYAAVERRLLKIYATVQYCIGKHGSAKVLRIS